MILPPFLKEGDTIGILSTARSVQLEDVLEAKEFLQKAGLKVKLGKTIGPVFHQFAGEDTLRALDLQNMLNDKEIKAILCAKGGYGTIRILDFVDFSVFKKMPKWIAGYSDVTALHYLLNNIYETISIHSVMASGLKHDEVDEDTFLSLINALFGKTTNIDFTGHSYNVQGKATGLLIGGNLSLVHNLISTKTDFNPKDKILFIEEVDEYLYHIDRMMWALKNAGKLSALNGMIIGGMSKMNDNEVPFGWEAEEIIFQHVRDLGIPVVFGFPAGHQQKNLAFYLGRKATIEIIGNGGYLKY